MNRSALLMILAVLSSGCNDIAERMAPRKQASPSRTAAALQADELFWSTLHGGQYEQIPAALAAETAAYLQDPADPDTAAHVGWLHIWRISESSRLPTVPPGITDDATLSRKYFDEALALHPGEARYQGFLASATLAEGAIHHDEQVTRHGYFMLLDAIKAWPEFNLFTAGYVMSSQPANSDLFKKGLDWEWHNLDVCVGENVDRTAADYSNYLHLETHQGRKRVCWNSWIAPHNLEGFFFNLGDMLVKSGDWETGRKAYGNAKLSAAYQDWRFRELLERRITDAPDNVAAFNAPRDSAAYKPLLNESAVSCVICHQN